MPSGPLLFIFVHLPSCGVLSPLIALAYDPATFRGKAASLSGNGFQARSHHPLIPGFYFFGHNRSISSMIWLAKQSASTMALRVAGTWSARKLGELPGRKDGRGGEQNRLRPSSIEQG
jgi:hypothetical protein